MQKSHWGTFQISLPPTVYIFQKKLYRKIKPVITEKCFENGSEWMKAFFRIRKNNKPNDRKTKFQSRSSLKALKKLFPSFPELMDILLLEQYAFDFWLKSLWQALLKTLWQTRLWRKDDSQHTFKFENPPHLFLSFIWKLGWRQEYTVTDYVGFKNWMNKKSEIVSHLSFYQEFDSS